MLLVTCVSVGKPGAGVPPGVLCRPPLDHASDVDALGGQGDVPGHTFLRQVFLPPADILHTLPLTH